MPNTLQNLISVTALITNVQAILFPQPLLATFQRPLVPVVAPMAQKVCAIQRIPVFIPVPVDLPDMNVQDSPLNDFQPTIFDQIDTGTDRTFAPKTIVKTITKQNENTNTIAPKPVDVQPTNSSVPTMSSIRQVDDDDDDDDDEDDDDSRGSRNDGSEPTDDADDIDDDADDDNTRFITLMKTKPRNLGNNLPGIIYGGNQYSSQEIAANTNQNSMMDSFQGNNDRTMVNVLRTRFPISGNKVPPSQPESEHEFFNPDLPGGEELLGRYPNIINTGGIILPSGLQNNRINNYEPQGESVLGPNVGDFGESDIFNPGGFDFDLSFGQGRADTRSLNNGSQGTVVSDNISSLPASSPGTLDSANVLRSSKPLPVNMGINILNGGRFDTQVQNIDNIIPSLFNAYSPKMNLLPGINKFNSPMLLKMLKNVKAATGSNVVRKSDTTIPLPTATFGEPGLDLSIVVNPSVNDGLSFGASDIVSPPTEVPGTQGETEVTTAGQEGISTQHATNIPNINVLEDPSFMKKSSETTTSSTESTPVPNIEQNTLTPRN